MGDGARNACIREQWAYVWGVRRCHRLLAVAICNAISPVLQDIRMKHEVLRVIVELNWTPVQFHNHAQYFVLHANVLQHR